MLPKGLVEARDLPLGLRHQGVGPEREAVAGLSGSVGDAPPAPRVSRPVELHHESFVRPGGEGEALLAEHPPSDEELHGEAGDRALDEGESTTVLEEGLDLLFREVEAEAGESHGDHHVEAEDAVGTGEGVPEGGGPAPLGMSVRTSPVWDGQPSRSLEREDRRGVGSLDLAGGLTDGAGWGRDEGGAGQRRSSRRGVFFTSRSKRMPTAARSSSGISSPMSWTAWTMWVRVRVPVMIRVARRPKWGGSRGRVVGVGGSLVR